eukprot:1997339-Rhodomonas_salina.1
MPRCALLKSALANTTNLPPTRPPCHTRARTHTLPLSHPAAATRCTANKTSVGHAGMGMRGRRGRGGGRGRKERGQTGQPPWSLRSTTCPR